MYLCELWIVFDQSFRDSCPWKSSKMRRWAWIQLNKCETDPYFLQIFQSNTSVCLIISMFCKSCEPICEPEITPVLYHLENLQKSKQKQFHVQCSVHKSYKTRKWTSLCIGNFEKNMDLSRIYLAVPISNSFFLLKVVCRTISVDYVLYAARFTWVILISDLRKWK